MIIILTDVLALLISMTNCSHSARYSLVIATLRLLTRESLPLTAKINYVCQLMTNSFGSWYIAIVRTVWKISFP
jgi:hypothetical protein